MTEIEMLVHAKRHYARIAAGDPSAIPDFYDWLTSLPQDERDQLSAFLKENDNDDAPWRK